MQSKGKAVEQLALPKGFLCKFLPCISLHAIGSADYSSCISLSAALITWFNRKSQMPHMINS